MREKIINTTLELYNVHGERNISHNQISAKLGISSGHLYYYFKSRRILIRELFDSYSKELLTIFTLIDIENDSQYVFKHHLDAIFNLMWKYRFFHENINEILQRDPILCSKYVVIQCEVKNKIENILKHFHGKKLLCIPDEDIKSLTITVHFFLTTWLRHDLAAMIQSEESSRKIMYRAKLRLIGVVKPYKRFKLSH